MNVLLIIFLSHRLMYAYILRSLRRGDLRSRLAALQKALERRDYGLCDLDPPRSRLEAQLDACVKRRLQIGKLQVSLLRDLRSLWEQSAQRQAELEQYVLMLFLHSGICTSVATLESVMLTGEPFVKAGLSQFLAGGLYAIFAGLAWRKLPKLPLLHDASFQMNFLTAYVGETAPGPWAAEVAGLEERSWKEGRRCDEDKRAVLRACLQQEEAAFSRRLAVQSECLPFGELVLTLGLGLCLWTQPLMAFFERVFAQIN